MIYDLTEDVTMLNLGPQRWRLGRGRHRPAGEPFEPGRHGVEIVRPAEARPFILAHHYAGTWPAARLTIGLYRQQRRPRPGLLFGVELAGVAVFAVGTQERTIPRYAPGRTAREGVELSRFVLLDEVEGNAETWMLARALAALRAELPEVRVVVSYSDPVIRRRADGSALLPGHVGGIYQGAGAVYMGRGKPDRLIVGPDGRAVNRRTLSKLRGDEEGAAGAYQQLLALGAPRIRDGESGPAYVARALDEGPFRALRHPGNHVYAWALDGLPLAEPHVGGAPRKRGPDGVAMVADTLPWGF